MLHNVMRQLLRQVSVQHSLKNQETRARRVTHAHRLVALATARCAVVAKTRVAIGRLRVAPTASHATVQLVLQLVLLVTAIRVRHVMTVLLAVTSVRVMTARLVRSVTAIRVRVVILVQTAQRVRLVPTVMVVAQTA